MIHYNKDDIVSFCWGLNRFVCVVTTQLHKRKLKVSAQKHPPTFHQKASERHANLCCYRQTSSKPCEGKRGLRLKERYIFIYEFFYSHFLLSCSFIYSHLMIQDIFWSLLLSKKHSSFKDNTLFENLYLTIRIVLKQNSKFLNFNPNFLQWISSGPDLRLRECQNFPQLEHVRFIWQITSNPDSVNPVSLEPPRWELLWPWRERTVLGVLLF